MSSFSAVEEDSQCFNGIGKHLLTACFFIPLFQSFSCMPETKHNGSWMWHLMFQSTLWRGGGAGVKGVSVGIRKLHHQGLGTVGMLWKFLVKFISTSILLPLGFFTLILSPSLMLRQTELPSLPSYHIHSHLILFMCLCSGTTYCK